MTSEGAMALTNKYKTKCPQEGFTLIELLIILGILGILAAIAIPNVSGFLGTGCLSAANTELQNVKTAAIAYYAEFKTWPHDSTQLVDRLVGNARAQYSFEDTNGFVIEATNVSWSGITWSAPPGPSYSSDGKWGK
jgi:prepilin-type N-terminal cleavage/methylation domain-containing protein